MGGNWTALIANDGVAFCASADGMALSEGFEDDEKLPWDGREPMLRIGAEVRFG